MNHRPAHSPSPAERLDRACIFTSSDLESAVHADLLVSEFGLETVNATSEEQALAECRECSLLVVQETNSPVPSLRLVRKAHALSPDLEIVVVALTDSIGPIEYYEAGATAFVSRKASRDELASTVGRVTRREAWLAPEIAHRMLRRLQTLSQMVEDESIDPGRCEGLTSREREIVHLLGEGYRNGQIAERLGITEGTVKTHVHNILEKLDVDSRHLAGAYWRLYQGGAPRLYPEAMF